MPHSSPDDGRGGIFKSFDNFVLEVFQAVICISKPKKKNQKFKH